MADTPKRPGSNSDWHEADQNQADAYMDYLEERVAELEVHIDMHNSARQDLLGRLEARDNIIDALRAKLATAREALQFINEAKEPYPGQRLSLFYARRAAREALDAIEEE